MRDFYDSDLVYTTGNGLMCGAFRYGEMIQAFGPPYSSGSLFKASFVEEVTPSTPRHEEKAAVWTVTLSDDDGEYASVTDLCVADLPCMARHVESERPLTVRFEAFAEGLFDYVTKLEDNAYLFKSKNGNAIYNDYPLYFPQFFVLYVRGDASVTKYSDTTFDLLTVGKADFLLVGGPSYPEALETFAKVKFRAWETLKADTLVWWHRLFDSVTAFQKIPEALPEREDLAKAIEEITLCIISQQSKEGGVLAGYNYHLGYVRDQFGVCMGLLHLGLFAQAKQMLRFYCENFRRDGKILNAQAMGAPGIFHFAENDKVEITGYLLLQFFRYADASGDTDFLSEQLPFLRWLFAQQEEELLNDTLPFNGDETYIAGGLLPRDAISDGSAEATALFLLSGQRLSALLKTRGEDTTAMDAVLARVRSAFPEHFLVDGQYAINDPGHFAGHDLPPYRYGVCMNCPECFNFGWTKLCEDEMYLCPTCIEKGKRRAKNRQRYFLPSALLMPAYLGFELPEIRQQIREHVIKLTDEVQTEGHFYSMPDAKVNVGYDYGLLLINQLAYGLPGAGETFRKLLSLRDDAGVYPEYFMADRPFNTRYRPWESAIDLDAMLIYAEQYGKNSAE